MAERNIKILVRDKKALVEGGPVIVCGNSDYTITFDFDDDWSPAGVRTARFVYVRGGQVHHQDVVFEGTTASVPVLSGITSVKVGVFEGDLSTTTPASIRCKESILCGTGKPEDPTPDVYDQIMALFDSLADQGAFGATEEQARQIEANRAGVEALVNGTTPAGNAAKLGGQAPEFFATAESVKAIGGQELLSTPILETALSITIDGDYNFKLGGGAYTADDLPSTNYRLGQATIKVRGGNGTHVNTTVILWGVHNAEGLRRIATNYYTGAAWTGWKTEVTSDDVLNNNVWTELSQGFDLNNAFGKYRTSSAVTISTLLNRPPGLAGNNEITVEWFPANSVNKYGTQVIRQSRANVAYIHLRSYQNYGSKPEDAVWGEWRTVATDADLANCLQLKGGTVGFLYVQGEVKNGYSHLIKNASATVDNGTDLIDVAADNKKARINISAGSNKAYFLGNDGVFKELLHAGNSAATKVQASAPSDTSAVWVW